jgi:hypothetical protein
MDPRPPAGTARLVADVARAADLVAPMWPLTSFVAVNPLGGLQHLGFERATAEARRWLGARTHPPLAEHRDAHARGLVSDADLRGAIAESGAVGATDAVELDGRPVDAVELVRLDLLHGPDAVATSPAPLAGLDVDTARAVAELVATWCAAFVDAAGVPWAMPGREDGLYRAWRRLAPHDRRLRRLAGPDGSAWLAALPEHPAAALAAGLAALGVDEDARVDGLRGLLGRLPGWAGHAHWHDEWAAPDPHRPPLRLVDLLAVQAATTVAAAGGAPPPGGPAPTRPAGSDLLDARVAAVLAALDVPASSAATAAVADVLRQVAPDARAALWLTARESSFRDRLLALLDRPAPDVATPANVQAAFCIDVRSEGLRRHLEEVGGVDTIGFAGFFGVPISWRPLGSPTSQPRAPVLVTPRHEVTERPVPGDDPGRHLAVRRTVGSAHDAFHAAKGSAASPFALAEASGWVLGPLAAARTLAPSLVRRVAAWARGFDGAPRTRPAVDAALDDSSGLALEERALFAEAIVRTMGLTRFAPLVVLCGHGSSNVNNPHGSSYDCGACGGAPGGDSARTAAAILNDPAVRAALADGGIDVPTGTWFAAGQHDTVSDVVTILDRGDVPASHEALVSSFEQGVAAAGAALSRERARRLPGDPARVRVRGHDWAQVRPEWGLAGNAAFVVGPRSVTSGLDLACRVFLHSYDADADTDGLALETIMTAPLVVAQWISAQYYFSAVDPDVFGAGDKLLHNPVGGVGVVLGEGGDLQVGLPAQAVASDGVRSHEPLRLLAVIEAPLERTAGIIERNRVLQELVGGRWMTLVGREHAGAPWMVRSPEGGWSPWSPAGTSVDRADTSLEIR